MTDPTNVPAASEPRVSEGRLAELLSQAEKMNCAHSPFYELNALLIEVRDARATIASQAAEIEHHSRCLAQERERTALTKRQALEVIQQAIDCLRGETPEDCSVEEARDDTIAKLRAFIRSELQS